MAPEEAREWREYRKNQRMMFNAVWDLMENVDPYSRKEYYRGIGDLLCWVYRYIEEINPDWRDGVITFKRDPFPTIDGPTILAPLPR